MEEPPHKAVGLTIAVLITGTGLTVTFTVLTEVQNPSEPVTV